MVSAARAHWKTQVAFKCPFWQLENFNDWYFESRCFALSFGSGCEGREKKQTLAALEVLTCFNYICMIYVYITYIYIYVFKRLN